MTGRAARAAMLALLLAGCGSLSPSPTPPAAEIDLPEPGRPFDGDAILTAMRESRRPGGVPDAIETQAIADTVAESIWTVDGEPWSTMAIGGSCGPASCLLEVAGGRSGRPGEDSWTFSVATATGEVTVVETRLGSLPAALVELADERAREADAAGLLDGLVVASASWLAPPDTGQVILAYRAGDEEGSCRRDVRVDLHGGDVAPGSSADC